MDGPGRGGADELADGAVSCLVLASGVEGFLCGVLPNVPYCHVMCSVRAVLCETIPS